MEEKKELYKIFCEAIVLEKPKYCYTEMDIEYYAFDAQIDVLKSLVTVIVSKTVMQHAMKQAFVNKIYPKETIWIEAYYDENQLYANKIVLINDILAAAKSKNLFEDKEYEEIIQATNNEKIVFKAKISHISPDHEKMRVHPDTRFFLPSFLDLQASGDVLDELYKKDNIFKLHVSEEIIVEGNLKSLLRSGYEGSIKALNISLYKNSGDKQSDEDIKKEAEENSFIFNSINNLSYGRQKLILQKSLAMLDSEKKIDVISNTLSSKEKRKLILKILFCLE